MKKLSFPLYHATSTLFEESIQNHGLGGINPVKELKVIGLMSELEKIADQFLPEVDEWRYVLKYPVSRMTMQSSEGTFNWQHGEVYLTPSIFTARRYSKNKYGSEAITHIFMIMDLLEKNSVNIPDDLKQNYPDLLHLRERRCEPVIYRIKDLPVEYLSAGERGEDVRQLIKEVEGFIESEGWDKYEGWVQQTNFRAGKPIPWEIVIA